MPEISRFYGIVIRLFLRGEHNPPHIHAEYGEYNGLIEISTAKLIEGYLPPKALAMVTEWAEANRDALQKMWDTKEIQKLPPLK